MTKRTTKPRGTRPRATEDGPPEVPPGHRDGHVSAPVKGCVCLQCRYHRASRRRRMADHALAKLWEQRYRYAGIGPVRVGATATAELIDILTGGET